MALQKQKIDLILSSLDNKTDDKMLQLGKLSKLENADMTKIPTLEKRKGYAELSSESYNSLYTKDNDLLASKDNTLYCFNSSISEFVSKGSCYTIINDLQTGVSSSATRTDADVVDTGTYRVITDKVGTNLYITVFANGSIIKNTTLISATASEYRLVYSNNFVWVVYRQATELKCYSFNLMHGNITNNVIVATIDTDPIDACAVGNSCVCVYNVSTVANIAYITPNNVIGAPGIGLPSPTSISLVYTYAVAIKSIQLPTMVLISIAGVDGSDQVSIEQYDNGFILTEAVDTSSAYANTIRHLTIRLSATSQTVLVDSYASALVDSIVEEYTPGVGSATIISSVSILSNIVTYEGNDYVYLCYSSASGIQNTIFLYDLTNSKIVTRMLSAIAGPISSHTNLLANLDDKLFLATSNKSRLISGTTAICNTVVCINEFKKTVNSVDVLDGLYLAAGFPTIYDGSVVVEHGFHLFPEAPTGVQASTGGSMSDGTYLYRVTYEWVDNNGRKQISAPSSPLTMAVTGGGSSQKVTLTIQTHHLSLKTGVNICVYRTIDGGTIYYKVTDDVASPVLNVTSALTVSFVDTATDASILDNEILYTLGGVFENTAIPSGSIISRYKNRLILCGGECNTKIYFSKPIVSGTSIEFSDLLYFDVQSENKITAVVEMDDKLLIATTNKVYTISGEPANSTGGEDSLSRPQLLPSNIGITNQASLASIPKGIMFQSNNGIWLIDRGLNAEYIGAPVFNFTDEIVSSVVLGTQNKVLFSTNNYTIVYDYYLDTWGTYPNIKVTSGVLWDNKHCFINATSTTLWLANDSYTDNGSGIKTLIETGWISLAGIQGFQRIYNILFLGEYVGSHTLVVEVLYDFAEIVIDTFRISGDTVTYGAYGDGDYGDESPFGGGDGVYNFSLKPTKQKCASIKLRISDANNGTGGFKLTHIAFECGTVSNSRRFSSERRMT